MRPRTPCSSSWHGTRAAGVRDSTSRTRMGSSGVSSWGPRPNEVVTSRVLWAIGFHQPPTYYVERWSLTGAEAGPQSAGRFRPELPSQQVVGEWSWYENPFVGSQPYRGFVVANLLLNSWDWKTSNNKIYELSEPAEGEAVVRRSRSWRVAGPNHVSATSEVVSIERFGQGTRTTCRFEEQASSADGRSIPHHIRLPRDLPRRHQQCHSVGRALGVSLLSRLSERQWREALRAAQYDEQHATRYIGKIKQKIAQGLALTAPPAS